MGRVGVLINRIKTPILTKIIKIKWRREVLIYWLSPVILDPFSSTAVITRIQVLVPLQHYHGSWYSYDLFWALVITIRPLLSISSYHNSQSSSVKSMTAYTGITVVRLFWVRMLFNLSLAACCSMAHGFHADNWIRTWVRDDVEMIVSFVLCLSALFLGGILSQGNMKILHYVVYLTGSQVQSAPKS